MDIDGEPTLCDLLVDPLLRVMMVRDGIDYRALLEVIDGARARLGLPAIADKATLACLLEAASSKVLLDAKGYAPASPSAR